MLSAALDAFIQEYLSERPAKVATLLGALMAEPERIASPGGELEMSYSGHIVMAALLLRIKDLAAAGRLRIIGDSADLLHVQIVLPAPH